MNLKGTRMQDNDQNRKECGVQLRRLSGLPNFPTDKIAVNELVATMLESCRDAQHALETVDGLRNVLEFAPRPVDIIDQAALVVVPVREFPHCAVCNGSGIAPAVRVVMIRGNPYEASGCCSCPKGKHVAAVAEQKAADERAKRAKVEERRGDKYAAPVERADYKKAAGGE